jgi:hypothetical protein
MSVSNVFVSAIVLLSIGICIANAAQDIAMRQYSEEPTSTPTYTPTPEPWDWDTEKVYKNCENKCLLCYECEQVVSQHQTQKHGFDICFQVSISLL